MSDSGRSTLPELAELDAQCFELERVMWRLVFNALATALDLPEDDPLEPGPGSEALQAAAAKALGVPVPGEE